MKIHKYKNYKEYVKKQVDKNKRKIHRTWARPDVMKGVADYLKKHLPGASFGICHGAKTGYEVAELRKHLGINVIGTDISETAVKFPNMIQWDFHQVKPEWVGKTDFIYSNTLDHSFDPTMCIAQWMSCIQPQGLCFIEWSTSHGDAAADEDDPFGASLEEYKQMFSKNHRVLEILEFPYNKEYMYPLERKILVIAHRDPSKT